MSYLDILMRRKEGGSNIDFTVLPIYNSLIGGKLTPNSRQHELSADILHLYQQSSASLLSVPPPGGQEILPLETLSGFWPATEFNRPALGAALSSPYSTPYPSTDTGISSLH